MTKFMQSIMQAVCGLLILISAARADDQTFQQASIGFIKTYFQRWSSSNAVALAYMSEVFPDEVIYFDKTVSHDTLMNAKHRFIERWPERHFVERADSLKVTCDKQHLCTIWGLVDWECRSQQRHETATGTSTFSFQLQDGLVVIAEDGFVVSRGRDPTRHLPEITIEASGSAKPAAPQYLVSKPPLSAAPSAAFVDNRTGNYSNGDIPKLRAAYFAQSSDIDWIKDWLLAGRKFTGTARSLGSAGLLTLSDLKGDDMHVMQFDTDQGPIACMITDNVPTITKGSDVRIEGTVSIFIDQTMYLANCSIT